MRYGKHAEATADVLADVAQRLKADYGMKDRRGWLREGVCPSCKQRELYANADAPWMIRCGRLNKCGFEASAKELYPDLFEAWSERYPQREDAPHAAATAYLKSARGLDPARLAGHYTQEWYRDAETGEVSATVRFPLPGGGWWQRLIDRPHRFKRKARFATGISYQGEAWVPPSLDAARLATVEELWIVEGIFDAEALGLHGIPAVSAMSCNNYPSAFLARLRQLRAGKLPTLIWALDADEAGREGVQQGVRRAREDGWTCEAAATSADIRQAKRDWNDLHLADRLHAKDIEDYRYYGALLIARTPADKARLIYHRTGMATFFFDHGQRLYWFDLDAKALDKATQQLIEKDPDQDEDERRDLALAEACETQEIANCHPVPLYFQANRMTGESWYYYRVAFPHGGTPVKDTFAGGSLASASEFKKRLLSIAPGAVFTGTSPQLDRIIKAQLYGIKTVQTIDFVGYSKEHDTYVLGDIAVREGRVIPLNDEDYFELGRTNLKTLAHTPAFAIQRDRRAYREEWLDLLWQSYGAKGLVVLSFWFGALFAEQIRERQKSFPFLQFVGEPGAGKSSLLEFLWKLIGRQGDYEGFDPVKATAAGRARSFAQLANLPAVLIESERDANEDTRRRMDWDELKTAYNGRSLRTTGVKNGGNDTYDPPFRAAIVISQNAPIEASQAIRERLCHVYLDKSQHSAQRRPLAQRLNRMKAEDVSYFMLMALRSAARTLEVIEAKTPEFEAALLAHPGITDARVALNHGQLMAVSMALAELVSFTEEQREAVLGEWQVMAVERQTALRIDSKVVQEFWDTFEYLDEWNAAAPTLNHSRNPNEIAVNLNHFQQRAAEMRQSVPPLSELKKHLRTSRRYRFVAYKAVNSAIWFTNPADDRTGRTVKCYVFQRSPESPASPASTRRTH